MPLDHGIRSYAQFGEDMLIAKLLPMAKGFYVDVGAHDPWRFSNTALLHARGWSGINIDADPRAIEKFRLVRPGDTNLNVGIADVEGNIEMAIFKDGAVNTFDPELAKRQAQSFGTPEKFIVNTQPLAAVLDRHVPMGVNISYMNVDCEGFDEVVLRGNDWTKYRPTVISVEVHGMDLRHAGDNQVVQFLRLQGYHFRAHYFVTSIFQLL